MNRSSLLTALGAAATTFLVVGAAVIEIVVVDPGAGILGVGIGFLAALLALVAVIRWFDDLAAVPRTALVAYAVFGYTFLVVWLLRYAHVANLDALIGIPAQLGVSVVMALAAFVAIWLGGPTRPAAR